MAIYPGNWPTHAVGNFVVRRTYTFTSNALQEIDMRAAAWFGAAWNLGVAPNAAAGWETRGILKRVTAKLVADTGVQFHRSLVASNNYNTIDATTPLIELDYRNDWPRLTRESSLFMQATDGTEIVEFEIWFDIEEA